MGFVKISAVSGSGYGFSAISATIVLWPGDIRLTRNENVFKYTGWFIELNFSPIYLKLFVAN